MPSVVKGLFGGSSRAESRLQNFRPTGFNTPGLIASQGGTAAGGRGISGFLNRVVGGQGQGGLTLTRTEGMNTALEGLMTGLAGRSRAFGTLLGRVSPGFGDLTRARVQAIRDAGSRTVGNLRSDLNQRRVLGSGFAQREIASTEAMFAQEEERARAEATVQELEMSRQLIGDTFSGAIEAAMSAINQFNFETTVAAGLTTSTNELMAANNRAQAEAASASEGGAFELLGTIVGLNPWGIFGG